MDESEETPATAARTVEPDDRVARELWLPRVTTKFGLLNAGDDHILTSEEVIEFSCRVLDAVAVPADYPFGGRRRRSTVMSLSLRSRIRMNAPNEKENEDEKSRENVRGKDGEEDDEPARDYRRCHTGLTPPDEKGDVGRVGCDFVHSLG